MKKKIFVKSISIICVLSLLGIVFACGKKDADTSKNEFQITESESEDFKEIIYTNTPNIVPEWYIQFDVNPSVGFYVDDETGFPVCGLVYNNKDAKDLLEGVYIVDSRLSDAYNSLFFNLVRAGYAGEDGSEKHLNIDITYFEIGKSLGNNEYETIQINNPNENEKIRVMADYFEVVNECGSVKMNSGDGISADFMDDYNNPEYDDMLRALSEGKSIEEIHEADLPPETDDIPEEDVNTPKVCGKCEGKGKYICPVCMGSGIIECDVCEGKGWFSCTLCGGTGDQMCSNCSVPGHDDVPGNGVCNGCNGTGICKYCNGAGCSECDYQTGVTCKGCAGSGVCNHCHGTGITKGTCPRCFGHTGQETCYRCDGKGHQACHYCNESSGWADCPDCGGTGMVY